MGEFFTALSQHQFLQIAVAAALLASIGCGVMGTYVVVKRIAFIAGDEGDAFGQDKGGGAGVVGDDAEGKGTLTPDPSPNPRIGCWRPWRSAVVTTFQCGYSLERFMRGLTTLSRLGVVAPLARARRLSVVQALRIGDLYVAGLPGEVFVRWGLEIKHWGPGRHTLVAELANGWFGPVDAEVLYALIRTRRPRGPRRRSGTQPTGRAARPRAVSATRPPAAALQYRPAGGSRPGSGAR